MTAPRSPAKSWPTDPVVRMIVVNWAIGALVGVLAASAVLFFDIGQLRTLLDRSDIEWAGVLLLFAGFAITFGGVVSASAVMFQHARDGG